MKTVKLDEFEKKTFEELFKGWKKTLDGQVKEFRTAVQDIRGTQNKLDTLNAAINDLNMNCVEIENEEKMIENNLDKIINEQKILESKLTKLESDTNKYAQSRNMQDISAPKTRDSVLAKCRGLTRKITSLDEELKNVVDSVNSLDYSSDPSDNLTKDTMLILNNYYESIRAIELSEVLLSIKIIRTGLDGEY